MLVLAENASVVWVAYEDCMFIQNWRNLILVVERIMLLDKKELR